MRLTRFPYSAQAVRDLRFIPEPVLRVLVENPDYADALLDDCAALPDSVFEYLWHRHSSTSSFARRLVRRPLSSSQRALVLPTENRSSVLAALFDANALDYEEVSLLPPFKAKLALSRILLERYCDDEPSLAHLLDCLEPSLRFTAALRSSALVASDALVLSMLTGPFATGYDISLARDLIELRPHLIPAILTTSSSFVVRIAVASSRYAARHLDDLLGQSLSPSARLGPANSHRNVLVELVANPTIPSDLRNQIAFSDKSLTAAPFIRAFPVAVPANYDLVADPGTLALLVDRALDTGLSVREATSNCWDLLVLSENPNLSAQATRRLYAALRLGSVRTRLGESRVKRAREALSRNFPQMAPILAPPRPSQLRARPRITPEDPRPDLFSGSSVRRILTVTAPKDARQLITILGEDPQAWAYFLSLLDSAGPKATLLDVARTAQRLIPAIL